MRFDSSHPHAVTDNDDRRLERARVHKMLLRHQESFYRVTWSDRLVA